MKNILKIFGALMAFSLLTPAYAGQLKVNVSGIKSNKGTVRVALWNDAKDFPKSELGYSFDFRIVAADKGGVSAVFDDLKPGVYAVSLFHDENDNEKLDVLKTFLGSPPLERYGFSNNAVGFFGPPKYKKTTFTIGDGEEEIDIELVGAD